MSHLTPSYQSVTAQEKGGKDVHILWQILGIAGEVPGLASWSMQWSLQGPQHDGPFQGLSDSLAEA